MKNNNKNIKPVTTLLSLLGVMALLFLILLFFPDKGISVGKLSLKFPTTKDFFTIKTSKNSLDNAAAKLIRGIDSLAVSAKIDSTLNKQKTDSIYQFKIDSILKNRLDSIVRANRKIQGNSEAMASLKPFFKALNNAKHKKVRILHYGDSQIESDRITSYLRNKMQQKFGGIGPGLFPVIQVSEKWTLNTSHSKNWKRYTGFGKKDALVKHNKYGALMSFCRFSPLQTDSLVGEKPINEAWILIKKPTLSYQKTKKYTQLNIYLRNLNTETQYAIIADSATIKTGAIKPKTNFLKLQANFKTTPNQIKIVFKSVESPDVLGLSLEGSQGVVMDNIPLRGASVTLFTKQNKQLLAQMYNSLKPDFIILEFGGNTVPYIKKGKSLNYYKWMFKKQIELLKKLNPNIPILVIGPADMSIKEKTDYITHPNLEMVRDALKTTALQTNCLFWDMYEAMGGENSMPKWVAAKPALGSSDYIHFSSNGAIKIAKIFNEEFQKLYNGYQNEFNKLEVENDSIQ